jgi:subtilase family serine protease
MRRALTLFAAAILPAAFIAGIYPAIGANAQPPPLRVRIAGSSPTWVAHAHAVGRTPASQRISFNVALALRHKSAARRLAGAVSNPKSKSYGHYLTARQFNKQFAPTASQVAKVKRFLRGQGLRVTGTAEGNRWISASGTAATIERAFSTSLMRSHYHGRTLRAAARPLSMPATLHGLVMTVLGVSQTASVRRPGDTAPPKATCSTFWNQHEQTGPPAYGRTSFPTPNCGYTAKQLRTAYRMQAPVRHNDSGNGVTVAIIDAYASPTIVADANSLAASQGEPQFKPGQYTETTFPPFGLQDECGGEAGWNTEESLDVEAVHALAPGANIHYIGASDCDTGIDTAVNYVIQNHVADIVSNSYGFVGEDGLGGEVALEDSMYVQAATEGIGFYFSSGDEGDNAVAGGTPHPEPDFPASDPWVTGVGGTSLAVKASGAYDFETAWGDYLDSVNFSTSPSSYSKPLPGEFWAGGGGGVSRLFGQPNYQRLDVPTSLAELNGSTPMRVVPDVAAVADPETGFLIRFDGTDYQYGGTSLACPVFAGIQALVSQGRRHPLGFANPSLYLIGLAQGMFHDVKAPRSTLALMTTSGGTLVTLAKDTSLTSTRGYDDTTGLGTPNGLAYLLAERLLG